MKFRIFVLFALSSIIAALIGAYVASLTQSDAPKAGANSQQFVGGTTYRLSGSGISSTDTSIGLTSFTIAQTGQKLLTADFGALFYLTVEPGNTSRQEFVSCTTVTQNAAGTATLSGCTRGLSPIFPYTASTTLRFAHAGGSSLIVSNPPQLYSEAAFKGNNEQITGSWGFPSNLPTTTILCTTSGQLCNFESLVLLSLAGAATSTETTPGLTVITKASVVGTGQASTSAGLFGTAPYVIENKFATTTPGTLCTGGTWNCIVATTLGKISQSWIDLTAAFTFSDLTATKFATASSTHTGKTVIQAANISTSFLQLNGLPYVFPSVRGASSSVLTENGSGALIFQPQGASLLAGSPGVTTATGATTTIYSLTIPANSLRPDTFLLIATQWDGGNAGTCHVEMAIGNGSATTTPIMYATEDTQSLTGMTYLSSTSSSAQFATSDAANMPAAVSISSKRFSTMKWSAYSTTATIYISFAANLISGSGPCALTGVSAQLLYQR